MYTRVEFPTKAGKPLPWAPTFDLRGSIQGRGLME